MPPRVGDGVARRIVDCDPQMETRAGGRAPLASAMALRAVGQAVAAADYCEPHIVVEEARELGLQIAAQQAHHAATSSRGRRQLSDENANIVSVVMPSVGAASTTRRTASAPARLPGRARQAAARRPSGRCRP